MRRAFLAFIVVLGVVTTAPRADAHGVLRVSDPQDRSVLAQSPSAVTLSFTEAPDLPLSGVRVLNADGRSFGDGRLEAMAGDAESVRVRLPTLSKGVYTVNWRIVSRVDGHLTAGAFAFGVQEQVTQQAAQPARQPRTETPLAVGGRWSYYSGLTALAGAAFIGGIAFGARRRGLLLLLAGGWALAAVGLVALAVAQRAAAQVSLGTFLGSHLGRSVLWRALAVGLAGAGLGVASRGGTRRWRAGLALVAVGSVAAMVLHVQSGHAAASSWPWPMVGVQAVHFLAAATWIGGLAALLVGIRGSPAPEKSAAAKRYSTVAGAALGVLVVTGVVRAVDQVDGWGRIVSTGYGRLVIVKSVLLVALAGLGAANRYRHMPQVPTTLRGLRRVGTAELSVAAGVFAVTGFLATSPPALAPSRSAVPNVVVDTSDFGTTMRARLTLSPGQAGENRVTVRLTDYDSGEPLRADRVSIRFALPANPAASETTLDLVAEGTPGTYGGAGTNLVLPGRWRLALIVERGVGSAELPVEIVTRAPANRMSVAAGRPSIYTVALAQGRSLQVYADPDRGGESQLHATFFAEAGGELAVEGATLLTRTGDDVVPGSLRRLGPGHFVADVRAPSGPWPIEVTATMPDGEYLFVPLEMIIPR